MIRTLPHKRQSDKCRNCGAACLAMIFEYYKKPGKIKEITNSISDVFNNAPSCRNYLMVRYASDRGFPCCVVSAKDIRTFIPFCLNQGYELIISYHTHPPEADSSRRRLGHMAVVVGVGGENVYVNDPEKDKPDGLCAPLAFEFLESRMKTRGGDDEITGDNVVMVLSPLKANRAKAILRVPEDNDSHEVFVFEDLRDMVNFVLDANKNRWVKLAANSGEAP